MKTVIQRTYKTVWTGCLSLLLFSACGQSEFEDFPSVGNEPAGGEPVNFSIRLSDTPSYGVSEKQSPSTRKREPLIAEWVKTNTFDATRSAKELDAPGGIAAMELFEDTTDDAPQTRAVMPSGTFFRVIAFVKTASGYAFQSVADYTSNGVGAPTLRKGHMYLPIGRTYRFIAYSFNNGTDLGALPAGYAWGQTVIGISELNQKDFMVFDSQDRQVNSQSFALTVGFTHKLCKLTIKISAEGFDSNTFTNCTGVYIAAGGNASSWTVGDGQNEVTANINNSALFNIPDNSISTVRLVPFAGPRPITVHFGTLTLGGRPVNNTSITSSQSVRLLAGKSYTMTVQFRKTPGIVISPDDINLRGPECVDYVRTALSKLTWAPGNLKSSDNTQPYNWTTPSDNGYYYTWNSTYTGNATTNDTDPCSKLDAAKYGTGWRLPNNTELIYLSYCQLGPFSTYNGVQGRWFMNNPKGVFLSVTGKRYGSGTSPTSNASTNGYYWSSTIKPNGISWVYYYLMVSNSSDNSSLYFIMNEKSSGFTVRCVK